MNDAIKNYMTPAVHTISAKRTMDEARTLMREHRIRHLPVTRGGRVVGMVTDRDLNLVETMRDAEARSIPVSEAMTEDAYTVGPDATLAEVCGEMARRKYGSAVVLAHGEAVGIFTTVDACAAVERLLNERHVRRAVRRAPPSVTRPRR